MGYQGFLIAPYSTGLDTDLAPWLLPVDAFTDIINGHIHHGVTEKRDGSQLLAEMVHSSDNLAISAATTTDPVVLTVTSTAALLVGDRIQVNYVDLMVEINGREFLVGALTATTIDLQNLDGADEDGTAFTPGTTAGQVSIFPALRMMGLYRYVTPTNVKELLAFDTRRAARYNATNDSFEPLENNGTTFDDIFTSSNTDYIWAANWGSITSTAAAPLVRLYFTNGKEFVAGPPATDGIWQYNSSTDQRVTTFRPQINVAQAGPFINGCKLIFAFQQTLVLLNTIEGGQEYTQRARWCQPQNPDGATAWDDATPGRGGFVDAPTGDHIISARFLQNILIVFFTDSVWSLSPTADPALLFRWDRINDFRACDAKMSSIQYDRYVLALGQRGITATDGVETRRIDERIEDFVKQEINASEFDKVFGLRSYANRRTWILYPEGADEDDSFALIFDDESAAYSKYEFERQVNGELVDINVLGYGAREGDLTLADFPKSEHGDDNPDDLPVFLDDADEETLQSFAWQGESDLFMGGTRNGEVNILETGGDDRGAPISFKLDSAAWNPYKEEGVECQMGYVDFYVHTDRDTRATISFFKNNDEKSYAERVIDFLPNLNELSEIVSARIDDDPTVGFIITSPSHALTTGQIIYIYGIEGAEYINGGPYTVTVVDENTFTVSRDMTEFGAEVSGITAPGVNPPVITVDINRFLNGDQIYFLDVGGMIEINFTGSNFFTVANSTSTTFELEGIDTTLFTAYTVGGFAFKKYDNQGVVVERPFIETKAWKRAYAGGVGYWHKIRIESTGIDRPVRILAYLPWFRKRGRRMIN